MCPQKLIQPHFQEYDEFDAYCRKRFKTWDKRLEKFEAARKKEAEKDI